MKKEFKMLRRDLLYWLPRILSLFFIAFIALFALDMFGNNLPLAELIIGLFMHLIPAMVLGIMAAIAWRKGLLGAIFFLFFALVYAMGVWGRFDWSVIILISGPALLISALFFYDWTRKKKKKVK